MPRSVNTRTIAKTKKAMTAEALISGWRLWKIFNSSKPPIMNMKAVSERERMEWTVWGGGGGGHGKDYRRLTKLEVGIARTDVVECTHETF